MLKNGKVVLVIVKTILMFSFPQPSQGEETNPAANDCQMESEQLQLSKLEFQTQSHAGHNKQFVSANFYKGRGYTGNQVSNFKDVHTS